MLLKSIDIQGFKSFADKTHLQFGSGITAVVGPNGSGKSNISDAVRWVLGEQSTKSLRGGTMEDVIFLGSDTRRPQGFAEVTLTIDNRDRSLNFDNDTVAVTRRYYRSHESEYLINGISVRLRDVNELFMDTGLGRDGYSMIGQGKIDSIVGAKPNERRDIFEEASGISRYRYRKIEAERKLDAAEENMVRLNDIFSELESRIAPLKSQSEKAERYLKLRDEKKELEIGLWMNELDNSKETLRNHERKVTLAKVQYDEVNTKIDELTHLEEQGAEQSVLLTTAIEECRKNAAEFEENAARTEGEIAVENNTVEHNNRNIERIKAEIDELSDTDKATAQRIEKEYEKLEIKKSEKDENVAKITETTDSLNKLIAESEGYSDKIEKLMLTLNSISENSSDREVKRVSAETALNEIDARVKAVNENIEELNNAKAQYEQEFSALKKDREELEDSISSYKNSIDGYRMRETQRREQLTKLETECEKLRLDIEDKKRRVAMLMELEKNMDGFNFAVKSVVKDGENGTLRGIVGPVIRNVEVEKQHSVAIETALGAAAQNIIVGTEADAKRAINYLKTGKKGRATFLPADIIEGRYIDEKGLEDCYGFVGVASDLVECDKKYKNIMVHLLGRIVIAEDLDSASAIAKKYKYKYKIVSLDGQTVNAGGSYTGGSLSQHTGLLSRAGDIDSGKKEIEKLTEKLNAADGEREKAQEQLNAVAKDIENLETEQKTANEDLIRVLGELRRVDELINTNNANIEALNNELADCNTRRRENSDLIAEATAELTQFANMSAETQAEIDKISGGRSDLSARREELSDLLTSLKLGGVEIDKDIELITRSAKNMESAMADRAYRIDQLSLETEQLTEQNANIFAKIEELKATVLDFKNKAAAELERAESIRGEREEAERKNVELRSKEKQYIDDKEKLSGELIRLEERHSAMMREYDDIIKRLFDEYELTRSEAEALNIVIENISEAKKELVEIKSKMRKLGDVNVSAIEEYKEVSERYEFLKVQIEDVEKSKAELKKLIGNLTETMRDLFCDGFEKINRNFKKTFTDLFGGGTAELTLSDPQNVLESGIDISVRIPGKTVSKIEPLSGGEKALVAISIYFAIMMVNPPPFCLLDEVESALDEVNVDRVAEYMHRMNAETQFICITHRRGTMESADMLYGVTMQEKGVSKLLEINISELEKKLDIK